jgi:DME family drug/metabolite transporter
MELTHRSGVFLVLTAGVIFSFGSLIFRATDDIGAWQYLTLRGYGAVVAILPVLLVQRRGRVISVLRKTEPVHVVAGLLLGSLMCTFIVALTHTDTAFVLLFQGAAPISAAVFSWLLLRERVSRPAMLATAGALTGVVIMGAGGLDAGLGWPILVVAYMPMALGLYTVLIRSGPAIDVLIPALIGGLTAGTAGLVVSLAGDGFPISGHDAALGLFAGAALIALPLPLYTLAQRVVPAPEAVLLLMSEIVLAPVWVWLVFDESPTGVTLVGGSVMFISVVWLTMKTVRPGEVVSTSRG